MGRNRSCPRSLGDRRVGAFIGAAPRLVAGPASAADDHSVRELPSGTVTFLFTDIEASTRLIEELGEEGYVEALMEHRRRLREAFGEHDGVEVDTQGDAFLYAFSAADAAVASAAQGQRALASGPVRVRMG